VGSAVLALFVAPVTSGAQVHTSRALAAPVVVRVVGNHLVNARGQLTRLLGVDRSGTEYACEQGWGIFDGPSTNASIAAIARWHANAVRVPLNEGCWLGLFTTANDPADDGRNPAPYEGRAYRAAVGTYVRALLAHHMAVILSLHALDAPDGMDVPPMADAAHSPAFWTSVATYFKTDRGVLFDLYNEPHSIDWSCWKDGCEVSTPAGSYRAAGMQSLVDAVRRTGATQPLLLGGLQWSSDERAWLANEPTDPDRSLVVSFHTYNGTYCSSSTCWNTEVAPLTKVVPVITGEVGEYDCATHYTDAFMAFADREGISYLGWAWDAIAPGGWSCTSPSLIENYAGAPSPEGAALHGHLAWLHARGLLPPSP
jgi:endoglucanase